MQSEDFLHNICKKNFVGIDELKIHMKRKVCGQIVFCVVDARIDLWLRWNLKTCEMRVVGHEVIEIVFGIIGF